MSARGIPWQTIQLPLNAGLNQRTDDRARRPPFLDICRNLQFDETGGLQLRYPYGEQQSTTDDNGTPGSVSSARKILRYGNEMIMFTRDRLLTWDSQAEVWRVRGTYLAVKIDEDPRFATTGDQIDADRAQIGDVAFYTWVEGETIYYAVINASTSAVIVPPTSQAGAVAGSRPRVVALNSVFLQFRYFASVSELHVSDFTGANGVIGGTTTLTSVNSFYDVTKVDSQDLAVGAYRRSTTTSYTVFTISPTRLVTALTKARTCDGPIAVASRPGGGLNVQVIRQVTATAVQGDFLLQSTLADVTTNQTIINGAASAAQQIAAAYRQVAETGTTFRCYVFAFGEFSPSVDGTATISMNYVDTAGGIGTASVFARQLGIASRAFGRLDHVYVWLAFGGQSTVATTGPFAGPGFALQNTYFLYRDDGLLVGKAIAGTAGGLNPTQGHLTEVQQVPNADRWIWCGAMRRKLQLGTQGIGFAARTLVDVTATFDSPAARRCARLGNTLYIAGGEIMQYDGVRIVELGHHIYPWFASVIDAPGGSVPAGVVSYKMTYRYTNSQGEVDRSTTATIVSINNTGSLVSFTASPPLTVTHKTGLWPPAVEFWRTTVDPDIESPFYLVSGQDPADLTNPNRYVPNNTGVTSLPTFNDALDDDDVAVLEANPENGLELENIAPPAAGIILATDTRLFLGDVAGDADGIWYSHQRRVGFVAYFHDTLRFAVPRLGGRVTAMRFLDQTLFVFRESAIYAFMGDGLNNLGQGNNYTLTREVSLDVGAVSDEAVAVTPPGLLFKSRKGWHLIQLNGTVDYIGDRVSDFDSDDVLSIDVLEKQHQVRIVLSSTAILVWDYRIGVNQWGEWREAGNPDVRGSCLFDGAHILLIEDGHRQQLSSYDDVNYGYDWETTWIRPAGLAADVQNNIGPGSQASSRVRKLQVFGRLEDTHRMRLRVAANYQDEYYEDTVRLLTASDPLSRNLQETISPRQPQCEVIKLRVTAVGDPTQAALVTNTFLFGAALLTDGTDWLATLEVRLGAGFDGELGNALGLTIQIFEAATASIDVRDRFRPTAEGAPGEIEWVPDEAHVGIAISGPFSAGPTIAELEAAINAASALIVVDVPDVSGSKVIDIETNVDNGGQLFGSFVSGLFGDATGQNAKFTAIGLEVGIEDGLYRRLPVP